MRRYRFCLQIQKVVKNFEADRKNRLLRPRTPRVTRAPFLEAGERQSDKPSPVLVFVLLLWCLRLRCLRLSLQVIGTCFQLGLSFFLVRSTFTLGCCLELGARIWRLLRRYWRLLRRIWRLLRLRPGRHRQTSHQQCRRYEAA